MFGTWITQIQEDLRKHFPASKNYTAADFKREPMPVSVGHFLEHALTRRAAMIQVNVDPEWFDVKNPDLQDAERRWREALTKTSRYPAGLWEQSVSQAVSHVVSFLVTPADSFAEFASGGSDETSAAAISSRLKYFRPYSALRAVIQGWVERRSAGVVSKEDLRLAILKADRSIVENYEPSDWMALLQPLYELAAVSVMGDREAEVPTSVLKPLFEAKGADEIVRRIEAIESIGGHRKLSEVALLKALGPTEVQPEPEPVPEPEASTPEPPSPPQPVQLNDIHATGTMKVVPRWMQFANKVEPDAEPTTGDGGPTVLHDQFERPLRVGQRAPLPEDLPQPEATTPAPAINAAPALEPIESAPALRPVDLGGAEPLMSTPEVNPAEQRVLGDVNPLQRAWFVNNLFGGDYIAFSQIVGMLDEAPDWEAASHVIGMHVFERNDVDIYSQPAIEFTNAVEARFQ